MTDDPPPCPPDPYHEILLDDPGSRLTADEVEFGLAMREYQLRRNRRYPAWCEVLYVLRLLGYRKADRADRAGGDKPTAASVEPKAVSETGSSQLWP